MMSMMGTDGMSCFFQWRWMDDDGRNGSLLGITYCSSYYGDMERLRISLI